MDVKQAVAIAKKHITELFAEEQVSNLGLEEVEFSENAKLWRVTLGFSRPWDEPRNALAAFAKNDPYTRRNFKVVEVSDPTGEILSVKSRIFQAAT